MKDRSIQPSKIKSCDFHIFVDLIKVIYGNRLNKNKMHASGVLALTFRVFELKSSSIVYLGSGQ